MYSDSLHIDDIRQWLVYEPATGHFRWRKSPRYGIAPGMLAGCINNRGYVHLSVLGGKVTGHRLAWAFAHGAWPEKYIDHINGIKSDNRIANLRDVHQRVNMQNQRRAQRNSKTGLLGVSPLNGKFLASIVVDGQKKHLGWFREASDAHAAYVKAKRLLHAGCQL